PRRTEEQSLQRVCVQWLKACVPGPRFGGPAITAVNPIPAKSKAAAGISKAMGLRAGVHDFVMCWKGRFIGIEIKPPKGVLSAEQKVFHEDVTLAGGLSHTVRSLEELRDLFAVLGVPTRESKAA
ncbi:MAG TPA: hypothetical protein VD994_09480, partial [Prosthecobacter sp.]|nr:hypothetical protein [Prosthecobacter sp.]